MHDNFHSVVAIKVRTTGRSRERYKDKILKYTKKRGEKWRKRGRKEKQRVISLVTTR